MTYSRRDFMAMSAALAVPKSILAWNDSPYEKAAKDAVRWIRAQGTLTGAGKAWPSVPGRMETMSPDLYSGTAGVVLLLAEAGSRWKDKEIREDARQGAKDVQSWCPQLYQGRFLGLYTGLAGAAYALSKCEAAGINDSSWRSDPNLNLSAAYATDVAKHGKPIEANDVISGLAGLGLALLEAPLRSDRKGCLDWAAQIGEEMIARGEEENGGLRWMPAESYTRNMPNFSHGTAGVAFFLAKLYARTNRKEHLEAAVKGGEYLLSIANKEGNGCLIFHSDPDGLNRYYLGWCHGPAGTSQLWWQLAKVTEDKKWSDWAVKSADSLLALGVPEKRTEGYWNNEGLCCGTAGIGRFFLDMHRRTGDKKYFEAAELCAKDVLAKAVRDENGARWSFAEHRVRPTETAVQPGLMQGAAGVALFLMEMASPRRAVFKLPIDAE